MASHIGKLPITIPAGVEVVVKDGVVNVKGPKGEKSYTLPEGVVAAVNDGKVELSVADPQDRALSARHGLARSIVASLIEGVDKGFEKKLEIVGTGYRVTAKGKNLDFALGYSHGITIEPPEGVTFTVTDPTHLTVSGTDKQVVGEIAAKIRKLRAPEPYKGKGIRYVGEHVRRKAGKAGK